VEKCGLHKYAKKLMGKYIMEIRENNGTYIKQ
jgi:hypothetical protein